MGPQTITAHPRQLSFILPEQWQRQCRDLSYSVSDWLTLISHRKQWVQANQALELIPACTLNRSPIYHRADTLVTLTHRCECKWLFVSINLNVLVPEENSCRQRGSNQNLLSCSVQTTAPPEKSWGWCQSNVSVLCCVCLNETMCSLFFLGHFTLCLSGPLLHHQTFSGSAQHFFGSLHLAQLSSDSFSCSPMLWA